MRMTIDEQTALIDGICGKCRHYDDDDSSCTGCGKIEAAVRKMNRPTHKELCLLAARFVKQHLYHCKEYPWRILMEPGFRRELPDVFAFTRYNSVLFECKASRADFLRDRKKPFRADPRMGVGEIRYYLVNEGEVRESEMPEGWYLFEAVDADTVRVPANFTRFGIRGQLDVGTEHNTRFQIRNASAEIDLMWSWEYRNNHGCLKPVPDDPVKIIFRQTQDAGHV